MKRKLLIVLLLGLISILCSGCLPGLFPEPNNPPVLTSIPIETITVGEEYVYNVFATDPDGNTLTYSLTAYPAGMTINTTTGVISWTPAAVGSYGVTVKVSDGDMSNIQSFTITVSPVPVAPTVVSLSPLEAVVGELYTGQVTATPGSNATLAYSLVGALAGMTINSITGVITWTPLAAGNQAVTVVVTDGAALSDSKEFTITVSSANQAPIITSTAFTSVTIIGVAYTYDVNATDPDGDTLTYFLTTKPDGMNIDFTTGVITWTPAAIGSYEVTVEVSDGELTDTQSFTITVSSANQAPIITSTAITSVTIGVAYTYDVNATDADGDTLTYSLTTNPSTDMIINPTTGVINWTPTAVGSYEVTVEVSDGELTYTQSFTITVNPSQKRVVMWELFEGPGCSHCKAIHSDIVQLGQEYENDELVILEEYGWDTPTYTGWGINDVVDRYYDYFNHVDSDKSGFPAAFFNGINQFVYYGDKGYTNYKAAIEKELVKPAKIAISASYSATGKTVSISGSIANISSGDLNNLVVEAMVYEDSVYSEYRKYNVNHVVRDIITYEDSGEQIASFSPGGSHEFSLTSSLSNVHNMNNIHVVVYVQALNSPTKEILQAFYVN